MEILMVLQMV
ncbi:hypothetical protein RDI58_000955 [Solanum bulbocastanum]|uniref:Uncharacterized protein n=1 Tax=Solanum bulbocastanum TaxID=147425 RepID=A0AAN8UBV7_SOLBU